MCACVFDAANGARPMPTLDGLHAEPDLPQDKLDAFHWGIAQVSFSEAYAVCVHVPGPYRAQPGRPACADRPATGEAGCLPLGHCTGACFLLEVTAAWQVSSAATQCQDLRKLCRAA